MRYSAGKPYSMKIEIDIISVNFVWERYAATYL